MTTNVVFELGRITLTAAQLVSLETSATIPRVQGEQVTLSSEGQGFAQGELVKVGQHLGVRIDALSSSVPAPAAVLQAIDRPQESEPQAAEATEEVPETGEPV